MTKAKLEDRMKQLRQLRSATPNDEVLSVLRKALRDRSNLVVAEAAKAVADLHLANLVPDLLGAFDRLFEDPTKKDSKCWGKTAIVKALTELEYSDSPPFVRGARHIQMEPVWGGQEDAAMHLRAACCLALVQCDDLSRTEIFRHLVDAMADSADPVRLEAVRAIAQMNGDEASLLLRLKARMGDRRPIVTGHVFDALLSVERERAIPFVAQHLQAAAEIRDEAALALGASRLPQAINVLIETWNQTRSQEFRNVLLRALSASGQPAAIDFLLNLVRTGGTRDATSALEALKLHHQSPEIQSRVEQAQKERTSAGT